MAQFDKKEFQQKLQKIEQLVQAIESSADPNVRASAVELMQSLMELHGAGLERMLEVIFESSFKGSELIDELARDELVESLLLLYSLHPLDVETRVMKALDKVRPYLQSHKGNVELVSVNDGVVHLKLQGNCDGCASSAMTLKLAIEEAIYESAPDIVALEVEGVVEQKKVSGLVQLERAANKNGNSEGNGNGWKDVSGLNLLADGAVKTIDVSARPVIFCRIGKDYYAYSDTCPECGNTMNKASLEATVLICPACRQRFDVMRAGRSLDKPNLYLEPYPLLMEQEGQARISLPKLE